MRIGTGAQMLLIGLLWVPLWWQPALPWTKSEGETLDTTERGLALIKSFEGCYLEAYLCPARVWTIGYGHTDNVEKGQTITREQAETLLVKDLGWAEDVIERHVPSSVALNPYQFDALVSFVFNVGEGAFKSSTLLKELKRGNYDAVPQQLMRWTKAGRPKRTLKGLVRRRHAEAALWNEVPLPLPVSETAASAEPMPQSVCPSTPPMSALARSGTILGSASAGLLTFGEWMIGTAGEASKKTQESLDATSALLTHMGAGKSTLIMMLVLTACGIVVMRRVQAHFGGKIG